MKTQEQKQKEQTAQRAIGTNTSELLERSESKETSLKEPIMTQIPGTPLLVAKVNEGFIITCGKYRREEIFESMKDAVEAANILDWENLALVLENVHELIVSQNK